MEGQTGAVFRLKNKRYKGLREAHLDRVISVIYRPQTERVSHYLCLANRPPDAVLHFDQTRQWSFWRSTALRLVKYRRLNPLPLWTIQVGRICYE